LLFGRELQLQLIINTLQQLKQFFPQVDAMLPKVGAFKQYYVRKQELVYFRA